VKALIIGNGVAGVSTAQELRSQEASRAALARAELAAEKLEISIFARESYDFYSRIRLPEVVGGEYVPAELLAMHKPSWYAERKIDVSLAREVVSIDRVAHRVMLATGEEAGYDALVLALGSDPLRPALPGSYLPGVCTVREYDDASRLRSIALAHADSAAVVGGGLLGLEAARHLQLLGVARVTVLEVAPRLLPRQLDQGGAALLERRLEAMGIEVFTGAALTAFEGRDRLVSLAYVSGGVPRRLETSVAVVSMGVRPRIGLAKAAGLATARGIVVDRFLRTSDPSIYALGDCAEFERTVLGIIPAALEQAPCCAAAILGDETRPYAGTIPSNTLKVAGIDLFSAGLVERLEGLEELVYEPAGDRYERYLLEGGILVGAIVIGSKERARAARARMGSPTTKADIEAMA
jgi:nitrite reductase (NADH) large subunit